MLPLGQNEITTYVLSAHGAVLVPTFLRLWTLELR